jgi:FMN reductase
MNIAVVTGNPKPQSRTLEAAVMLATAIGGAPPATVIDVVTLGPSLLGWGDDGVKAAVEAVRSCDAVVVASPTYKAAYTGLLKAFLAQFPADGLAGVVAVPLMLGAGPAHAMAPEVFLKPVLVELGAVCPTRGLYLLDSAWESSPALDSWLAVSRPAILAVVGQPVR